MRSKPGGKPPLKERALQRRSDEHGDRGQRIGRAQLSAIRGVNVDGVVRTLTSRGLVVEIGSDPDTGGGLCRTTELFLEKMGLRSLGELPSLAPLLPELAGFESDELSQ